VDQVIELTKQAYEELLQEGKNPQDELWGEWMDDKVHEIIKRK